MSKKDSKIESVNIKPNRGSLPLPWNHQMPLPWPSTVQQQNSFSNQGFQPTTFIMPWIFI